MQCTTRAIAIPICKPESVALCRCKTHLRPRSHRLLRRPSQQEAARQDPDNAEYRVLIKQYKTMESTKEAGNQAFKQGDYEVTKSLLETFLPPRVSVAPARAIVGDTCVA